VKLGAFGVCTGPTVLGGPRDLDAVIRRFIGGAKHTLYVAMHELDSEPIARAILAQSGRASPEFGSARLGGLVDLFERRPNVSERHARADRGTNQDQHRAKALQQGGRLWSTLDDSGLAFRVEISRRGQYAITPPRPCPAGTTCGTHTTPPGSPGGTSTLSASPRTIPPCHPPSRYGGRFAPAETPRPRSRGAPWLYPPAA
jgi:hypothetical protein